MHTVLNCYQLLSWPSDINIVTAIFYSNVQYNPFLDSQLPPFPFPFLYIDHVTFVEFRKLFSGISYVAKLVMKQYGIITN